MPKRLLDRQASLLAYLTSGAAIFGKESVAPPGQALHGIDPARLRLEARFSYEKRMEKITSIFPRTFAILGHWGGPLFQDFVEACPPSNIERLDNARQLHDFLLARWRCEPPYPPYLCDIAACEFACAQVRAEFPDLDIAEPNGIVVDRMRGIRRRHGIRLLRCTYDIRPLFENGADAEPARRETLLAITIPPQARGPQVFELLPAIFDLLAALDDWVDPAVLGVTEGLDELVADLARHGLVEARA